MNGFDDKAVCPHFHGNDERCARRFNLQRLSEVFDNCLGEFNRCAIYHELTLRGQPLERVNHDLVAARENSTRCVRRAVRVEFRRAAR